MLDQITCRLSSLHLNAIALATEKIGRKMFLYLPKRLPPDFFLRTLTAEEQKAMFDNTTAMCLLSIGSPALARENSFQVVVDFVHQLPKFQVIHVRFCDFI